MNVHVDASNIGNAIKGLKRIAVNDSFIKGKRAKLELEGHTHFFGGNARGKTSTILLVPLFLGLRPDRIVDRIKGTFLSYYLPTTRSYVAFEYLREDGLCTVIVFTNRNRDTVLYRFIKGGFDETIQSEQFTELLDQLKNTGETLKKLSTRADFEMSVQIESYSDYAAVICNLKSRLARKNGLYAEMLRFSLCESHRKLEHMAELSFISVGGKNLHDKLTKMITSIFDIDKIGVGEAPQDNQLPELLASIKTLNKFRQSKPRFEHGIKLGHATEAIYADLLYYQTKAVQLNQEFTEQIQQIGNKRVDLEAVHSAKLDDLNQRQVVLRTDQLNTQTQYDVATKRLQQIQQTELHYQESKIENKRHEYKNLDSLKSSLDATEKHLMRLRNENTDIQTEHLQSLDDQRNETQAQIDKVEKQKQEIWQQENQRGVDYRKQEAELQTKLDAALKTFKLETGTALQMAQDDVSAANFNLGSSAAQTEEEKSQIAEYAQRLQEALHAAKQARDEEVQASAALDAAEALGRQHTAAGEAITRSIKQANEQIARFRDILYPQNTLLAALRQSVAPESCEAAIKLIDKSLLARSDIKLELVDSSELFFGCALDLSAVATPLEAESEEELTQKITEQQELIDVFKAEEQALKREITKHAQVQKQASNHLVVCRNQFAKADEAVARVQHIANEQQLKVNAAIQLRVDQAGKVLNNAKHRLFEQQKASQKAERELQQQFELQKDSMRDAYSKDLEQLAENRKRLDAQILEIRQAGLAKQQELIALYHDKLAKRGVDLVVLQKAEKDHAAAKENYNRVSGYHVEIQAYEDWLETVYVNKPTLLSEQQASKQLLEQLAQQLAALDVERKALIVAYTQDDRLLQDKLTESKKRQTAVALVNEHVQRNITDVIQVEPSQIAYDNYELFIDAAETAITTYRRNLAELAKVVQFVNGIVNAERESQQYDEWEKRKAQYNLHRDKSNFDLLVIRELEDMLEEGIPLAEQNARTTFISTYQRVIYYFESLKEFKSKVASASRRLNQSIQVENPLTEVTDFKLTIGSVVDETTPMYADMKNLKRRFEESPLSRSQDGDEVVCLPDDSLMLWLSTTMRSLNGANFGSKNKNDLVYLNIELRENGNHRILNNDETYENASSTGVSKFMIVMIFTALARYLNGDENLMIHLPFDELGVLDVDKSILLLNLLHTRNIYVVCAQPAISPYLNACFNHRYQVDRDFGFRRFPHTIEVEQPDPLLNPLLNPLLQMAATT